MKTQGKNFKVFILNVSNLMLTKPTFFTTNHSRYFNNIHTKWNDITGLQINSVDFEN